MADQVKQLAFRKLTTSEIENGTAVNVLTTDASTHYVLKSIEATQVSTTSSVTAEATIGLTAGLSSGEFTSLGTVAKGNRLGLTGSVIMDSSSTLSIRPTAKAISFADEQLQYGMENNTTPSKFRKIITPSVNGAEDTALIIRTTIDKSAQTFSSPTITMNADTNNHGFIYERSDGVNLKVIMQCGTSNGAGFEVWNADNGTNYGYYYVSYAAPHWDGDRYIFFWNENNKTQLCYYDLEESLTNLASANTYGGGNSANFYHGVINDPSAGNHPNYSFSSYDNRRSCFYLDRHSNRRFLAQYFSGHSRMSMFEFPTGTLTNYNATANEATKWVTLAVNSNSARTDYFGNNSGNTWSFVYWVNNYASNNYCTFRMTYDDAKGYYFIYVWNGNYAAPFIFSKNDYDGTGNAAVLNTPNNNGYGLIMLSTQSASDIKFNTNWFTGYSGNNGAVRMSYLESNRPAGSANWVYQQERERWVDGSSMIMANNNSPNRIYKISFTDGTTTEITTGMTDSEVNTNYNKSFWYGYSVPSASLIASRNYSVAPSVKIRVTGILSDQ